MNCILVIIKILILFIFDHFVDFIQKRDIDNNIGRILLYAMYEKFKYIYRNYKKRILESNPYNIHFFNLWL